MGSARKIAVKKAKARRALLERQLHYTERHIAAGAEHIERQRRFVEWLEAEGRCDSTLAASGRALLTAIQQEQRSHIADHDRITRLLAELP